MLTRRAALIGAASSALTTSAAAQANAMELFYREGRYLPWWLELRDSSDPMAKQFAAFMGDEARALAQAPPFAAAALAEDAGARPALEAIAAAAAGRHVVMLNEAHTASRHRGFLAQVLRTLRPLGFTHLAAEDFLNSNDPGAPNIRAFTAGAVLPHDGGFYRHDPVYAEALREAAELGYSFFPYEQRQDQDNAEGTGPQQIARRETAQAENFIANGLNAFPDARFIVYVGYAHLRKRPDHAGNVWFAERLVAMSGVEPLTIDQAMTGSFGPHGADSALAQAVLSRFAPRESIVLDQTAFATGPISGDLMVFHPSRPDMNGRPGWLVADATRHFVRVRERIRANPAAPVLLQAIHAHEGDRAIPADHVLIESDVSETQLLLRPGRYHLRLETTEGFQPLREIEISG